MSTRNNDSLADSRGSDRSKPVPNAIQAVERAARVMSAFTYGRPRLTLAELTQRLGTSKPTTHRYTKALREAGLLQFDERESVYLLGSRVLALAAAARAALPIIGLAGPYMERLVLETKETAVLSIWDGGDTAVVVRVENSSEDITISVRPGSRLPLFTSAQGRIFVAFVGTADQPPWMEDLASDDSFRADSEIIRKQGLAFKSVPGDGIRTVAAPVWDGDRLVAVMALVGTIERVPPGADSSLALALRETTAQLSTAIGSQEAI